MARAFVRRHGWTAFAGLSALVWALPLAAWAGGVDFNRGAWYALLLAGCLFPVWAFAAWRARSWRVPGPYRWEPAQMSRPELAWTVLAALAATGVVGWLNAAATVDWSLLAPGLRSGRIAAWGFLAGAAILLAGLLAATGYCWRRATAAYRARLSRSPA